ncbi:hypothetical protein BHYA_0017g00300 [Botrytis hyacinthi]|uniref:Uncharacterized protein n=1 Tax=Botrytis hyacinthi TaxID=278943 RepID=A0A4Z1H3X5_9HELO|nr:hypothetical protein BHYA_0017g00300 [Botrytis hyacinthi]
MSKMPVQKQHSDKLLDLKLQRKRASIRKINAETRKIKAEAKWLKKPATVAIQAHEGEIGDGG